MKIIEQGLEYRVIERFLWLPTTTVMHPETRWWTRQKVLQKIYDKTTFGFYRSYPDWTDWDWVD